MLPRRWLLLSRQQYELAGSGRVGRLIRDCAGICHASGEHYLRHACMDTSAALSPLHVSATTHHAGWRGSVLAETVARERGLECLSNARLTCHLRPRRLSMRFCVSIGLLGVCLCESRSKHENTPSVTATTSFRLRSLPRSSCMIDVDVAAREL